VIIINKINHEKNVYLIHLLLLNLQLQEGNFLNFMNNQKLQNTKHEDLLIVE